MKNRIKLLTVGLTLLSFNTFTKDVVNYSTISPNVSGSSDDVLISDSAELKVNQVSTVPPVVEEMSNEFIIPATSEKELKPEEISTTKKTRAEPFKKMSKQDKDKKLLIATTELGAVIAGEILQKRQLKTRYKNTFKRGGFTLTDKSPSVLRIRRDIQKILEGEQADLKEARTNLQNQKDLLSRGKYFPASESVIQEIEGSVRTKNMYSQKIASLNKDVTSLQNTINSMNKLGAIGKINVIKLKKEKLAEIQKSLDWTKSESIKFDQSIAIKEKEVVNSNKKFSKSMKASISKNIKLYTSQVKQLTGSIKLTKATMKFDEKNFLKQLAQYAKDNKMQLNNKAPLLYKVIAPLILGHAYWQIGEVIASEQLGINLNNEAAASIQELIAANETREKGLENITFGSDESDEGVPQAILK